jgi:hypothetical protein
MPAPCSLAVIGPPAQPTAVKTANPKAVLPIEDFSFIFPPIGFQLRLVSLTEAKATPVPFSLARLTDWFCSDQICRRRFAARKYYWVTVKMFCSRGSGSPKHALGSKEFFGVFGRVAAPVITA